MEQGHSEATVHVVDDGPAMRESLRWLLESASLTAETYGSAVEFLERFDPSKPGCLVLDVRMPEMTGLELQKELSARGIAIPIIFITAFGEVSAAVRACKGGALDFIEKPFSDQRLLEAIHDALARDRVVRSAQAERAAIAARAALLTRREKQVIEQVIDGKTNRAIAQDLGLSHRTVEVHRGRGMEKLRVQTVAELVRLDLPRTFDSSAHAPDRPGL